MSDCGVSIKICAFGACSCVFVRSENVLISVVRMNFLEIEAGIKIEVFLVKKYIRFMFVFETF